MVTKPDIYTFVDASVGLNQYTKSFQGAYGFVHMSTDLYTGVLHPWGFGVQIINGKNVALLEAGAMYLALTDVWKLSPNNKITIVTDSNDVYYKMLSALSTDNSLRWTQKMNEFKELILDSADLMKQLRVAGYKIRLELCCSHCQWDSQLVSLKSVNSPFSGDVSYAKDLCYGNYVIDYNVNKVACNMNPMQVQQYGNGPTVFKSNVRYANPW